MKNLQWVVLAILIMLIPLKSIAVEVIEIVHSTDFVEKVTRPETIYDIQCEVNL